ncbi:HAD-IIIC family phosphatase [Pedobacter hartonius]|nr:HAD-IIIC family phosphatase [Pedobacter hartonius]
MELIKDFKILKRNLKKDFSGLKKIKVALMGDTATQFLTQALRASGFDREFDLQIWEADFNQIERQVFDPSSELYDFSPEIVIIYQSSHKLLSKYNKLPPGKYASLADTELDLIGNLCAQIDSRLHTKIVYYNYTEIDDSVYGNYSSKVEASFLFQLRKLNYKVMEFSISHPNFYLLDLSSMQNKYGKCTFFQTSIYINTEMVLSIDILPAIASLTTDLIGAMYGKFKKCIILDLDNTMWGGIIGDDGMDNIEIGSLGIGKAFTEFQYWLKKLKNRGIILAVCSKNTESIAREPFEKHPDMVLRLDDIAVFVANWENKVDNIHHIRNILNIGFDSMVFLDDNPFERNIVRESIPLLTIPELPEDPAEYLEYLYSQNLFETVSVSDLDAERTKQYQVEAQRAVVQQSFTSEADFLESLNMLSIVRPFDNFNIPRAAQLSQRSNQFNLRTVRYSEADIELLGKSEDSFTFSFTLEDKFGDNGLICIVILKSENNDTLFIDTWLMSCRVLKRGMEHFVLNCIADFGQGGGFKYLKGEYIPTLKNEMVKDHYSKLAFKARDGSWILNLSEYEIRPCFINKK